MVFLQHLLGPDVRVVPVLCGPFAAATRGPGRPEDDPGVARFIDALGELDAREGSRLLWVLAVDMAHVGRRYGDDLEARAGMGELAEVEERDRRRIAALAAGDADGFWELVRENEDDLKWCGASPLYAFLKATAPEARRAAALRAVEHRSRERRELRRPGLRPGRGGASRGRRRMRGRVGLVGALALALGLGAAASRRGRRSRRRRRAGRDRGGEADHGEGGGRRSSAPSSWTCARGSTSCAARPSTR